MINKKYNEFLPSMRSAEELVAQVDGLSSNIDLLRAGIENEVRERLLREPLPIPPPLRPKPEPPPPRRVGNWGGRAPGCPPRVIPPLWSPPPPGDACCRGVCSTAGVRTGCH